MRDNKNKRIIFGLLLISLLFASFIFSLNLISAEEIPGLLSELNPEELEQTGAKISEKWEYLGREWKTILLNNSVVKAIDSFFHSINIVFIALFAKDYSLSLELLLIIFLWIFLLVEFNIVIKNYVGFPKWIAFIVALCLVIILAQFKFLEKISNFVIWIIFGEKQWWVSLLIGLLVIIVVIFIGVFIAQFGRVLAERRRERKEQLERIKLESGAKVGEELSRAAARK